MSGIISEDSVNNRESKSVSKRWALGLKSALLLLLFGVATLSYAEMTPYQAALSAIKSDDHATFSLHAEALKGEALEPYLYFFSLRHRLRTATQAEIEAFNERFPGDFLNSHLRAAWSSELVRRKAWEEYLRYAPKPRTTPFLCARAEALYHTEQFEQADALTIRLWRVGRSQPSECDAPFKKLDERGKITSELARQRVALAINQDEIRLARFIAKRWLSQTDQEFLEDYLLAHQKPAQLLERLMKHKLRKYDSQLIEHALKRLALNDPEEAMKFIKEVAWKRKLKPSTLREVKNHTVLRALLQWHPEVTAWGRSIPVAERSATVKEWTVRYYLRHQDWAGVIRAVRVMPPSEQKREEWSYWMGRARQAQGDLKLARQQLEPLSTRRSYYGFLAAAALGRSPVMNEQLSEAPTPDPKRYERIMALHHEGETHWARLEWRALQAKLDDEGRREALWVAHQLGWHDLVVLFASSVGQEHNLALRFPIVYREEMEASINKETLDLPWVMALTRRESAFFSKARSPVGASGLMQIMPATGRQLARQMRVSPYQNSDLMTPGLNIMMGTRYLSQMKERFGGSRVLATAAYNAGPSNVQRWLPDDEEGALPVDIWIDTLTYRETREYVRAVLSFAMVYHWRLYQRPSPLFLPEERVVASAMSLEKSRELALKSSRSFQSEKESKRETE